VVAGVATGGVAWEAGGGLWLTEEAAPFVGRVAVRAYQVARPAVEAYARRAVKGMAARMFIDAGFQFGTTYVTADPSKGSKFKQAVGGINGTQVAAAGLVSVGENARAGAGFLVALGTATTTNLVTVSRGNVNKYGGYWHVVDFHDSGQSVEYVRNVVIGTIADPLKELGAGAFAKRLAGGAESWASQATGRATRAVLKVITEKRVELPASVVLGGVVEVPKKLWERQQEDKEQREAKERAEAARRAATHSPKPTTTR